MKKIKSYLLLIPTFISIVNLVFVMLDTENVYFIFNAISALFLVILTVFLTIAFLYTSKEGRKHLIVSTIVVILYIAFNFSINNGYLDSILKPIPDFSNKNIIDVLDWGEKNNYNIIQLSDYSDFIPRNHIIFQKTSENEIIVFMSLGPNYDKNVTLPNMKGWTIEKVLNFIEENHLKNVTIKYENSEEEQDTVISADKFGLIKRSDEITILVSRGPEPIEPQTIISDFHEKSLLEAKIWLEKHNINYTVEYDFHGIIPREHVIEQVETKNNNVITFIKLIASKGRYIEVPDFSTLKFEEITKWALLNNLTIDISERYDDTIPLGVAIEQNPKAGATIEEESHITLLLSKGQLYMKDFKNLSEFTNWAQENNVEYEIVYEFHDAVLENDIIEFSHKINDLIKNDDKITVKVSQGKPIVIPNFVGMTKSSISTQCQNLSLNCNFVYGSYSYSVKKDTATQQSVAPKTTVKATTTISITLSRGTPQTFTLILEPDWFMTGNATTTINYLRTELAKQTPGVKYTFYTISDNSLPPGGYHPNSQVRNGSKVTQGQTYKIYIVK